MDTRERLLAVYDGRLRGLGEVLSADGWTTHGPLWLARWGRHGLLTYESLDGLTGSEVDDLVLHAAAWFASLPGVEEWEWKTRAHDDPTDLVERLLAAGLEPEETETVMLGEASDLAGLAADLPAGVAVRRVDTDTDRERWLARAARLQREVHGQGPDDGEVLARSADPAAAGTWVAARGEEVLATGRVEVVEGTGCAGLWGGVVGAEHRGQGLYRALVAARAAWSLERGVRYLHSDCTALSRPILQRAGLVAVTTSTPYVARVGA